MSLTKEYYKDSIEISPYFRKYILMTLKEQTLPILSQDLKIIVLLMMNTDINCRIIIKNTKLSKHEILFSPFINELHNLSIEGKISNDNKTTDPYYYNCSFYISLKQLWRFHCDLVEK